MNKKPPISFQFIENDSISCSGHEFAATVNLHAEDQNHAQVFLCENALPSREREYSVLVTEYRGNAKAIARQAAQRAAEILCQWGA